MSRQYKIFCVPPKGPELSALFKQLPSPINRSPLAEVYNYRLDPDGIYFIDREVNAQVAALAFKMFLDAVLAGNQDVTVSML